MLYTFDNQELLEFLNKDYNSSVNIRMKDGTCFENCYIWFEQFRGKRRLFIERYQVILYAFIEDFDCFELKLNYSLLKNYDKIVDDPIEEKDNYLIFEINNKKISFNKDEFLYIKSTNKKIPFKNEKLIESYIPILPKLLIPLIYRTVSLAGFKELINTKEIHFRFDGCSDDVTLDLHQIETFSKLEYMHLNCNIAFNIQKIKKLSSLKKLEILFNPQEEDISFLDYIPSCVEELVLDNEPCDSKYLVRNINKLPQLSKLKTLVLKHRINFDCNCIANSVNLTKLIVEQSNITNTTYLSSTISYLKLYYSDFSFLDDSKLFHLKYLAITTNTIIDLQFLQHIKNIVVLELEMINLVNSNFISDNNSLKELKLLYTKYIPNINFNFLNNSKIESLKLYVIKKALPTHIFNFLSLLKNLKELLLWGVRVDDFSFLNKISNLQKLQIINSSLKNLTAISKLDKIIDLVVCKSITSLNGIQELQTLEKLSLHYNLLTTLKYLKNLNNVTHLTITSCNINNINVLENLSNLTYLSLDEYEIESIKPLSNKVNLSELIINADVTDITPILKLPKLKILNLCSTGLNSIKKLSQIESLEEFWFDNFPDEDTEYLSFLDCKNLKKFNVSFIDDDIVKKLSYVFDMIPYNNTLLLDEFLKKNIRN